MQKDNSSYRQALPIGFKLEEYEIETVLGEGGFGITYLALDTALKRKVVIKENFNPQYSIRDKETNKVISSRDNEEGLKNFDRRIEKFLEEAQIIANLDHPNIVKVHRLFKANGTAYFVMPYLEGHSLAKEIIQRYNSDRVFKEEEVLDLLTKLLNALDYLHGRGIYHLDIKPANILLANSNEPILIDFGSWADGSTGESRTIIESEGFTPPEQKDKEKQIGSATDIYALGASFYQLINGKKLPDSISRLINDNVEPLVGSILLKEIYSTRLLRSIDQSIKVNEKERIQDANEWLELIKIEEVKDPSESIYIPEEIDLDETQIQIEDYDFDKTLIYHESDELQKTIQTSGITTSSNQTDNQSDDKPEQLQTKGPKWKEVTRWVLLLPGVILGAGLIHLITKLVVKMGSNRMGPSDSWFDLIWHNIIFSLAYGYGAIWFAVTIAPRAKKTVAIVFSGLILFLSGYAFFVSIMTKEWMGILEITFINIGSICVTLMTDKDGKLPD
ncbi:serine/threonine protein kinase [Verrucomicrobia bacterium]|nr:serine/threonine protein kinase [Verrucomicrobiota bacterium]